MQISVKQSVSTDCLTDICIWWNSQLDMFQSVSINIEDITTWSASKQDKKLQRKLFDLNDILLKDFITVLTPFDNASKHIATGKEFSLRMVTSTSGGARPIVDVGEINFEWLLYIKIKLKKTNKNKP